MLQRKSNNAVDTGWVIRCTTLAESGSGNLTFSCPGIGDVELKTCGFGPIFG